MNKWLIILGVVIVLGVGLLVVNKQNTRTVINDGPMYSDIQSGVASGAVLLDVRTTEEFATGHFEKATNYPLQDLQAGKMPQAEKDTSIYVYCRSGNRSSQAATILENAGFTKVVDLGGLSDVESIGGSLIR